MLINLKNDIKYDLTFIKNKHFMKIKKLATFILILFITGFLILKFYSNNIDNLFHSLFEETEINITPYLNGLMIFFEAGTIGALADWFAIVAIFKKIHFLGIKIPHTNLIINNKQKIANGIADFVIEYFLDEKIVLNKINSKKVQIFLYKYLIKQETKETLINKIKEYKIIDFLRNEINQHSSLTGKQISLKIVDVLLHIQNNKTIEKNVSIQLKKIKNELNHSNSIKNIELQINQFFKSKEQENLNFIEKTLFSLKNKTNVSDFIEHKITITIISFLNNILEQNILEPKNSIISKKIYNKLDQAIFLLNNSSYIHNKIEKQKQKYIDILLNEEKIISFILDKYDEIIKNKHNLYLLNKAINQLISSLIKEYKNSIRFYISETIINWEDREMIQHIENSIAEDLQYIRINGAIIGGFIGLFLYLTTF